MTLNGSRIGTAVMLICVFTCGWLAKGAWDTYRSPNQEKTEVRKGQYEFVNPLLECKGAESLISREVIPFRERLVKAVQEKTDRKMVRTMSVYFRDLNDGPWFGIKYEDIFYPASLLKVPLMMAFLDEAQRNPWILQKKVKYEGDRKDYNSLEYIKPEHYVEYGKTYTVDELLYLMITYSDNNAAVLLGNIGWAYTKRVYNAFGLPQLNEMGAEYPISVQNYASFFRVLYNASFLSPDMSNKALNMLAADHFMRGIEAGVPPGVKVANKFGERESGNERQFHDCGIVYYPNYPYLLCIMTKGDDTEKLISAVEDISRITYAEVDRQFRLRSAAESK